MANCAAYTSVIGATGCRTYAGCARKQLAAAPETALSVHRLRFMVLSRRPGIDVGSTKHPVDKKLTLRAGTAAGAMSELYSDFTLTQDNCANEPIHRPEAIQGTGYLLGARRSASRSCYRRIGWYRRPARHQRYGSLGRPRGNSPPARDANHPRRSVGRETAGIVRRAALVDRQTELRHRRFGATPEPLSSSWRLPMIFRATRIRTSDSPTHCAGRTTSMRSARRPLMNCAINWATTGSWCIASTRTAMVSLPAKQSRDDLEPYLGLHYPATDIPQPSRDLLQRVRVPLNRGYRVAQPGTALQSRPPERRLPRPDLQPPAGPRRRSTSNTSAIWVCGQR